MRTTARGRWAVVVAAGAVAVLLPGSTGSGQGPGPRQAFTFRDVGEEASVFPHLAGIRGHGAAWGDLDGTGWPDLFVATFHNAGSKPGMLFRNDKGKFRLDDQPHLRTSGMGSGALFVDLTNSGRLDLLLTNWWIADRSLLLRNETPGGHWLDVRVEGRAGVNRMGLGARVNVYRAGKLGHADALLGCREISAGYGYCSGQEAVAHFGLSKETTGDLEIILPHGKGRVERRGVAADQRLLVKTS